MHAGFARVSFWRRQGFKRAAFLGLAAFLASALFGTRPPTSYAKVDLTRPDYHFVYNGEANMSYSGAVYVVKDDAWYTFGNLAYTAKWVAEGDGWASSDPGVNQLPLTSLTGSVTSVGKPDPAGTASPEDDCTAELGKGPGAKLRFGYWPVLTSRPFFPDEAPPADPTRYPYIEISFPFQESHVQAGKHGGSQLCTIISSLDPFNPNKYPGMPGYPIDQRADWGEAYFARANLLAPADMLHPAKFTRSFDFGYGPTEFFPAFDRYPPYGEVQIHIHSTVTVQELE